MLSLVTSGALQGVEALPVQVEVNAYESGEPRTVIVGLPDAAVKESSDRVLSSLTNSGYAFPMTRNTINLAPGDLRKEGPFYDLPIALGILIATEQMRSSIIGDYLIAGELGLSGELRPVKGALALSLLTRKLGKKGLILPLASAKEAALVEGVAVYGVKSLDQTCQFLQGDLMLSPVPSPLPELRAAAPKAYEVDFSEVKGQSALRRAVEVAVAGGHNLLMIGSPGSGKSMVAKRIPTIMPEPTLDEFLDILNIYSTAGISQNGEMSSFRRPFRSPHHTISDVGLLGGGTIPGPGEISLAHHGVLFLDELPEFKRSALEVMRQPLEDGEVTISRSAGKITLPSGFVLVAAMNPCPCGYLGDKRRECRCTPVMIQRYRSRVSGPLLDRIDIHIEAPSLPIEALRNEQPGESSSAIRERIKQARVRQHARFVKEPVRCNARMNHAKIRQYCQIKADSGALLQQAMEQLNLSARAYDRILKVARTIADLAASPDIESNHLLEAIQYRSLDRNLFY
ncbi:MAG: YifB family Mg chelatase-like AAA ATPase [Verrucomicrobiota bacterium]|nr:YifB family Mg chelatase-like AAA ATPase [Verrucomicrobiota bacterium]